MYNNATYLDWIRQYVGAVSGHHDYVTFPLIYAHSFGLRPHSKMLASSASVVALAKKMAKPDTKTVTRTISIPKIKIIKQPAQQTSKSAANDAVRTAIKPITLQNRYPINKAVNQRLEKTH